VSEHETVVLTRALPEHGLQAGDVGAIVHVYQNGKAVEVEFIAGGGATVAVATLDAADVRPLGRSEILHVRGLPAAL
jgi:hypothetical protein